MNIQTLSKTIAVCAAFSGGIVAAQAATHDLGVLVPGETYSYPGYSTVIGEYTPSVTGPVKVEFSTPPIALYSSAAHDEASQVDGTHSYGGNGQIMSYAQLEAGHTYYFYSSFTMNAGNMVIHEGTSELKLMGTKPSLDDPEDPTYFGGRFTVSENYSFTVRFNFPVKVGNVLLLAPDQSVRDYVNATPTGTSVQCDVASTLMQFYRQGAIKEGDEVTLRMLQVRDASDENNLFGDNGRVEIKIPVAAKPAELVKIIGAKTGSNNTINSYYFPGDENGIIQFVFDTPLSTEKTSTASIVYGNTDNLEVGVYSETIEGVANGETASFDFTGRLRRPIDMLPLSTPETQPEQMFVSFGNLYTADGQRVFTNSVTNPSGYGLGFTVNTLQYTIAADFTPARGGALVFGQPMEIWVMNGNKIKYETIRFEYTSGGEEAYTDITPDKVTEAQDPYSADAMTYTFDIPEMACDPGTPVNVRMTGVTCADGLDHTNDIFGDFTQASDGVDMITTEGAENFDVYDIAGVRVLTNASREALGNLARGLYIVNGKKLYIK